LLLLTLLTAGFGAASAQEEPVINELTQPLVSARIQALRDVGATESDDSILKGYDQIANWLAEAEVHSAAEKSYLDSLNTAPQLESEIRARVETRDYSTPGVDPASVSKLRKPRIEEKLTELRVELNDTIADKEAVDRRVGTEQGSAPNIQTRIEAIDTRIQELPTTTITIDPNVQPSQLEVSQWLVLAERKALVAERRSLQARLTSQPVRYSRRKAESDEFELIIQGLQTGVQALETELSSREESVDTEASISLDKDSPGYGLVQTLIDENAQIRTQRLDLGKNLTALKEVEDQVKQNYQSLQERSKAVQQIVSLSENSSSLGHVLMVHWHQTDNFRTPAEDLNIAGEIGEHVIRRTEHEDSLANLSNATEYLEKTLSVELGIPVSKVDEETATAVKNLLRSRRELYTELIAIETELINVQGSVDRTLLQSTRQFEEYQDYLSSRILWVPSHPPLSISHLKNLGKEFNDFVSSLSGLKIGLPTPVGSMLLILILISLMFRRHMDLRLQSLNTKVGHVREDSIWLTLRVLLITLVRSILLPLLLLVLASGLTNSDAGAAPYLSGALQGSAISLFLILFLRNSCHEHGIARVHFNWPENSCVSIRRFSTLLLVWWWPLLLLTAFIFKVEIDSINAVFGRLLFCVAMAMLCLAILSFLFSKHGIMTHGKRFRYGSTVVAIAMAIFFIALTNAGYIYSVAVFYQGLRETIAIGIGLIFFYFVMQRWLLVVRRRLRFNELLTARQLLEDGEAQAAEAEEINLITLSASVDQLLKAATLILGVFLLAYLWAPLFRALEAMQRVTLWTISDVSEGEAILTSITLASLALALLIGVVTFFAARNLPHLIALLLRSRQSVTPGSRYAIVKLLRYLIVGVGFITILSTLGLRWDRLQWLVAALGVGIGFGLQEIIANFISGLIILFERPIRVGDLVSVGESSGQVIRITIRATTIRDFDGKELLVPNKEFVTGRLLNWTLSNTEIRMTIKVGIAYGSDVRKAVSILEDLLENHEMVLDKPAPDVLFREFGDSSLVLSARYFSDDVEQRFYLLSDLHMKINDAFAEAGITIAFPQIDVHFDKNFEKQPAARRLLPEAST